MEEKIMHLLITEDDMALAQGLQRALQEKNRQVLCCKNIQETRQHLHQNQTDLLILDVNLPDGSGFDLLQEIRRTSDLPVILLTANDLEMDIVSGLEQGANDYITKPFSLAVLRARVNTQLRNRTVQMQKESTQNTQIWEGSIWKFDKSGAKGDYRMVILETRDLKKQYGTGETAVHALAGVNLSVENGEFVAVVGTSGSGKSTLLHMLGGLDRATSGKVYVDGKDIFALKDEELTIFRRRKIGFVFQSFNLVPVLSVYENIVLPLQLDGKTVDNAFIGEIAEALGLKEKLNVLPNQLSGGQQQRVAIARALAAKPAILLADEPTGNLDSCTSQDVMGLLKTTSTKFSQTIVMITHNEEIAQLADRIIRIEDGRIVTGKAGEAL